MAQSGEFNDSAANMTDQDLAARYAALKLTYDKLMADPSAFLRELTTGFIRLLDEVTLAEKDKEHEGKRERTWAEEDELHWADLRLGNLMVFPWPRGHSLGKWSKPDLGFSEYNATGIGVNTKTLETLLNGKVGNIPVSMGFRYRVANPFYRIWEGDLGLADVRFTREPNGAIHIGSDMDDDGREWLASYYTGSSRKFDDHERFLYALLGAQKLYDATKHTRIGEINQDY